MISIKDIIHIQMPEPDYGPFPKWVETYKNYPTLNQLFPNWIMAKHFLKELYEGCEGIRFDLGTSPHWKCSFNVIIPSFFDVISQQHVPMTWGFPPEDRPLVEEILMKTLYDYLPPLKPFDGYSQSEKNRLSVMCQVKNRENYIINCGGCEFKKELALRFGFCGLLL